MKHATSPNVLFHLHQKKKNEDQTFSKSKEEWRESDDELKLQFILKAIKRGRESPLYERNPQFILNTIPRNEILIYVRHINLEKPVAAPYLLYAQSLQYRSLKYAPSQTDIIGFSIWTKNKFAKLDFDAQLFWFEKFIWIWDRFNRRLAKTTTFNKAACRKAFCKDGIKQNVSFPRNKKRKWNMVPMPSKKIVFEDEPEPPPLDPYAIYAAILKKKITKDISRYFKKMYNELCPNVKLSIIEKVMDFRKEYSNTLLEYVDEMSDFNRMMFLGQRRLVIYERLGMDPFEKKYPCKKYPLYILIDEKDAVPSEMRERVDEEDFAHSSTEDVADSSTTQTHEWTKVDVVHAIRKSMAQLDELAYDLNS